MRKLGQLPTREDAQRLCHYLLAVKGVESHLDDDDSIVWILHDDDLFKAKRIFAEYIADPKASRFEKAAQVKPKPEPVVKVHAFFTKRHVSTSQSSTRVSTTLIVASVICYLLFMADRTGFLRMMLNYSVDFMGYAHGRLFYEIREGQVWRLVTPIFIHMDLLHLLFNMYWLHILGKECEQRIGGTRYLGLIVATAIPSNTIFYLLVGFNFGGMSGVIYGLAGFLWAYTKFHPRERYQFDPHLTQFFLFWYVLCWILTATSMLPVANSIHGVGGAMGILIGYIATGHFRVFRSQVSLNQEFFQKFLIGVLLLVGGIVTDYLTKR